MAAKSKFNFVIEAAHDFDRLMDEVDPDKGLVPKLGLVGMEINTRVAAMLPLLRVPSGVIVLAKPAESSLELSLDQGDVIHAVNGSLVSTLDALRSALDHLPAGTPVVLQVERDGRLMYVSFELD